MVSDAVLPVVYADESHNTGENLGDVDQPVFVLAGLHLDDEVANELVDRVKARRQKNAGEPKYQALSKMRKGRELLSSVFKALPESSARVVVTDKRYMAAAKIIDLALEPRLYDLGYNMHKDGSAKALANLVHLFGPVIGNAGAYFEVLNAFVNLLRKGVLDVDPYLTAVDDYLASIRVKGYDPVEFALRSSRERLIDMATERRDGFHLDTLDPAIPAVFMLCHAFGDLGPFKLVHDHSNVVERNARLLLNAETLSDPANPRHKLSLPVHSIEFADSKSAAQLQIVDWIAGAARDVGMSLLNPPRRNVSDELVHCVQSWLAGSLWPDPAWLSERLGIPLSGEVND